MRSSSLSGQGACRGFQAHSARIAGRLLASLLLFSAALPALASERLRFSGFGSFAYSHDNADGVGFKRYNSQPVPSSRNGSFRSDSIFGLQASYSINPEWEVTGQLVARDKVAPSFANSLEWAFVAYRPNDNVDVRVGRVGLDAFMLSDYRNLGFSQLWVRPPTEFYGGIPMHSVDGADIAYRFETGATRWRIKSQFGTNTTPFPIGERESIRLKVRELRDLTLHAERGSWQFKAGYAQFRLGNDFPLDGLIGPLEGLAGAGLGAISDEARRLVAGMKLNKTRVRYTSLGAAYDDGLWTVQGELARVGSDSQLVGTGTAGYLSIGRRLGQFTPYVVLARIRSDRDVRRAVADWGVIGAPARNLQDRSVAVFNALRREQHTVSLGMRWDFGSRAALKAQWDRSHVKPHGYGLWQVDRSGGARGRQIDVLSVALDFVF